MIATKLAQAGGVLVRVGGVMLLCPLVTLHLFVLTMWILPPVWGGDLIYWVGLLFVGAEGHPVGDEHWSWMKIPPTLAVLALFVMLAGAGWVLVRARQGLPLSFCRWKPKHRAAKLGLLLALAGALYLVVLVIYDNVRSPYADPGDWLSDALVILLLFAVPPFLTGCLLALLCRARKSEWLAGVLCIMALAAGRSAHSLLIIVGLSAWKPVAAAAVVLLLAGAIAIRYALRLALSESSSRTTAT